MTRGGSSFDLYNHLSFRSAGRGGGVRSTSTYLGGFRLVLNLSDEELAAHNTVIASVGRPPTAELDSWRKRVPWILNESGLSAGHRRDLIIAACLSAQHSLEYRTAVQWMQLLLESLRRTEGDDSPFVIEPMIRLAQIQEADGTKDAASNTFLTAVSLLNRHSADGKSVLDEEMMLAAKWYAGHGAQDEALLFSLRATARRFLRIGGDDLPPMHSCWVLLLDAMTRKALTAETQALVKASSASASAEEALIARASRLRATASALNSIAAQKNTKLYAAEAIPLMKHAIGLVEEVKVSEERRVLGNMWIDFAHVLKVAGDQDAAIAAFQTAIPLRDAQVNGKDYWSRGLLGSELMNLGRDAEAAEWLAESVRLLDDKPQAAIEWWEAPSRRIHLATVYARLKRWDDSRRCFETAFAEMASHPEEYANCLRKDGNLLLRAYTELSMNDEAAALRQKLKSLPSVVPKPPPVDLAKVDALKTALIASETRWPWPDSRTVTAETALADQMAQAGLFREAITHAARAASGTLSRVKGDDMHDEMLPQWRLLVRLYEGVSSEHGTKTMADPISLPSLDKSNGALMARAQRLRLLSDELRKVKRFREAELPLVICIRRHEEMQGPDVRLLAGRWMELAEARREIGDFEGVEQAYRASIPLRDQLVGGKDVFVRSQFGWFYLDRGKHSDAEPLYRETVEILSSIVKQGDVTEEPNLGIYTIQLGRCLLGLNQFKEAEETLERGFALLEKDKAGNSAAIKWYGPLLFDAYVKSGNAAKREAFEVKWKDVLDLRDRPR